jgi:glycerol-3-phosphate acyltransferase PlsX
MQKLIIGAFKPVLKRVLSGMDYQEYGGVPLLGVNGVVIIGHGSGSPLAITNMILKAEEMVRKDVNRVIQSKLAKPRETRDQQ